MAGPPRPSFPSSPTEPGIRRLGLRSSHSVDRPIRSQVVLAVILALVLLAIPLYLMRSPKPNEEAPPEPAPMGFSPSVPAPQPSATADERVRLAKPVRVRCSNALTGGGQEGNLCDALPELEAALGKAISTSVDCAPRTGEEGTLNFVLKVDFVHKTLHVFAGASGTWKGPQAKRATQCVKQALPAPNWDKLEHKLNFYEIAVLATYQPPKPSQAPLFE
ncbi:MAG TPA: hypothetical protein VLC09_15495 [Polyangiaceae bacterium]|nr:hypothetical protein [Polyangiaceae bacterium]